MAMASDTGFTGVKYKSITGGLEEHLGFRLSADSKTVATENVAACTVIMRLHITDQTLHARLESVSRHNSF